jgi:mycobactin peptide synthetase MbtE
VDALGGASLDDAVDSTQTRFEPMSASGLSADDLVAVTQLWSKSRDGTP